MKVVYVGVFNNKTEEPVELVSERKLDSYNRWTRGNISEFITFFAKFIAKRTKPGITHSARQDDYVLHASCHGNLGICSVVITDEEYPTRVAEGLARMIVTDFASRYPLSAITNAQANSLPLPQLKDYINQFQNPDEADTIYKIQKELDETKTLLHKGIESLLERGEKLDSLVAKSDTLSSQSKMFYTQAKKQNSCCVVM